MTYHLDALFALLSGMSRETLSLAVTAAYRYNSVTEGPRDIFVFKDAAETALARVARLLRTNNPKLAQQIFVAKLETADDVRAALKLLDGVLDASASRQDLVALLAWHEAQKYIATRPNPYAVSR